MRLIRRESHAQIYSSETKNIANHTAVTARPASQCSYRDQIQWFLSIDDTNSLIYWKQPIQEAMLNIHADLLITNQLAGWYIRLLIIGCYNLL
jgi:hypothetical protein